MWDNDKERLFDEAVDAIEKKEHRLIWADKLKAHYAWWKDGGYEMTLDEAKTCFDTIVDLQPTVEPTKHGRWEKIVHPWYECSECGERTAVLNLNGEVVWNYCPNCGAKMMDEVDDDETD